MLNDRLLHTPQTIATFTRHQIGTVERALKMFIGFGLVEVLTDGAYYMVDIQLLIGQPSTEENGKRKSVCG
ncbi:MAG: phage replisome organizer N-terminal domain-containing protein [Eubacteriales bacterium]|nr:phage replisome organizer N-terminal domain-containing protein [Eubacteriales bacterium]